MKRLTYGIVRMALCLICVVGISSCHSSKKAQKGDNNIAGSATTTVTIPTKPERALSPTEKLLLTVDSTTNTNYVAKVNVNLGIGGKSVSTNGSLKMRWNDVIQISLVDPIIGITEIGRMEFSKDNVLIVDRMNKQYVQESYSTLSALANTDISYEYIQALFWSESQKQNNNNISYKLPVRQPVTMNLKLSNINHKDSWETHTEVSQKYKKVTAEQLLKALSQLF